MYGGSGKIGRGGGGGGGRGGKRNHSPFPPPPPPQRHLPGAGAPGGRISIGGAGARNRHSGTGSSAAPSTPEETFSLVRGNPLSFAMIIRLAPDLIDEIRRVEAQGGTARIKFDANSNNQSGNVIDVGGKDFRFIWSRELGDLCDTYEERRSGEDGKGLLVESGCAWRKLNVQRILDESTKNHVKKRSEEAERKLKSRKAIVLDHGNPSLKNQMKPLAAAAVDVNPRRMPFKPKNEAAFKKRKVEPTHVAIGGPPKSVFKSGLSSTSTAKGRLSVSPLPSPPQQSGASASPLGMGDLTKGHTSIEEVILPRVTSKEDAASSEKEIPSRADHAFVRETSGHKGGVGATPKDLQNSLTTLLMENPKGMSLKALEKAIGDSVTSSARKIEPIIKKIAIFQAPGRYFLKPGAELESFKKPSSESGSSKEGSDVDVDIMTSDDDKGAEHKVQAPEPRISTSPIPWRTLGGGPEQNEIHEEKQDGRVSDAVETEKDRFHDDHETDMVEVTGLVPNKAETGSVEKTKPFSPEHDKQRVGQQMSYTGKFVSGRQNMSKNGLRHEQSDSSERISQTKTKAKAKRGSDINCFDEKSESAKRLKAGSLAQPPISRHRDITSSESPHRLSPDWPSQDPYKDHTVKMTDRVGKDGNVGIGFQKGYSLMPGRSTMDAQPPVQRSVDLNARRKGPDIEMPRKYVENLGRGAKHSERSTLLDGSDGSAMRSIYSQENFSMPKDDMQRETQDEDGYGYEKLLTKYFSEGSARDKRSSVSDSYYRKHGEQVGKFKDVGQTTHSLMGSFPKDNSRSNADKSPMVNGKGSILRRELSDLELGELREPMPGEETQGLKKQFERKSSFKLSENKPNASENCNSDSSRGRTVGNTFQDSRKQSSPDSKVGFPCNQEGLFRKRILEDDVEDLTMPQERVVPSQAQQFPRVDGADSEVGSQLNKLADMGSKSRKNEVRTSQGICLEDSGGTHKKTPASVPQPLDTEHAGQTLIPNPMKETKTQKCKTVTELTGRRKDTFWMENNDSGRKRRESSSDEDTCSYSKYEKDNPEIKGPIKDFSQYKEYVQEYHEKYGSYCSLNKILETYRNEFQKLGSDLDLAKGRDMEGYYNILGQLKETYRQCGTQSLEALIKVMQKPATVKMNQPCAACRTLRRRCGTNCPLAPYFPLDELDNFACVHKLFGASNVVKMIQSLEENKREDAVNSMVCEARMRLRDPVYGSTGAIFNLQKHILELREQLELTRAQVVELQEQRDQLLRLLMDVDHHQLRPLSSIGDTTFDYGNDFLPMQTDNMVGYDLLNFH
ncbi:hypothetical protein HHK36_027466 [Tetracentron sinense]|uniref:Uncharacterized protein n=1 Tax=Tetracentron sinense TaxID=13715 RepID=A0A834YHK0_TETSI|nr:hypothetical protein HHK36_027466 [Tetracentron sinense]